MGNRDRIEGFRELALADGGVLPHKLWHPMMVAELGSSGVVSRNQKSGGLKEIREDFTRCLPPTATMEWMRTQF